MITVINIWGDDETEIDDIDSEKISEEKEILQKKYFESLLKKQPALQIIPVSEC
jgi:hypothetical protein